MSAVLKEVPVDYERRAFIGSSDIAGIMGISPWQTRVSVWERKTRAPVPDAPGKKKVFRRGKAWESVVAEMLVAELESRGHQVQVLNANKRYRDPEVEFFASEIDYEIKLDDIPDVVNVELKTVHPNASKHWGESESQEYPIWYAAQGMFGLGVTGRKCCILAPLFGADEVRIYPIIRDEETIAGMRQMAADFWHQHVVPQIAPEPTNEQDVNRLFSKDKPESIIEADTDMIETLLRYQAIEGQAGALQAELELLRFRIKRFMGDKSILVLPGQTKKSVTWKHQTAQRVDLDALKREFPKVYKQLLRESDSRVFRTYNIQPESDYQ